MPMQRSSASAKNRRTTRTEDWSWRYNASTEVDADGRQLFRFHRRFPQRSSFGHVDVLLTVSMALAVVSVTESLSFDVDHIELYLRPRDAFRLGPALDVDADLPKWASAARVVAAEPEGDADLTIVVSRCDTG